MEIPLYVVDAFTNNPFRGNPAAVCPLNTWLDDDLMQAIAAENNLSETAFLVPVDKGYALRWFTPTVEADLCGHATLASAFVLSQDPTTAADNYLFQTKSGELNVQVDGDFFNLDFPVRSLEAIEDRALLDAIEMACGVRPIQVTRSAATCLAEFDNEASIIAMTPNMGLLKALEFKGLVVTARSETCDFVSRFFAPRVGIDEDPVTGSVHCSLIPYWHKKLGREELLARQVSARGGELYCRYNGERVTIGGQAVLFSHGHVHL